MKTLIIIQNVGNIFIFETHNAIKYFFEEFPREVTPLQNG